MRRHLLIAAGLLLVATNALVLAGAAYNRAEPPEATMQLTERELSLGWVGRDQEDSGIDVELELTDCRPDWFDASKLQPLGFDVQLEKVCDHHYDALPRLGYVVLEMEGPAWEAWLQKQVAEVEKAREVVARGDREPEYLEDKREYLRQVRDRQSRLLPVDVGPDAAQLRSRYPDRQRYLVMAAKLRMYCTADAQENAPPLRLEGRIIALLPESLHVPAHLYATMERYANSNDGYNHWADKPRYQLSVQYGRRLEPWLTAVTPLEWTEKVAE